MVRKATKKQLQSSNLTPEEMEIYSLLRAQFIKQCADKVVHYVDHLNVNTLATVAPKNTARGIRSFSRQLIQLAQQLEDLTDVAKERQKVHSKGAK